MKAKICEPFVGYSSLIFKFCAAHFQLVIKYKRLFSITLPVCPAFSDGLARHLPDLERFRGLRDLVVVGGTWGAADDEAASALGARLEALELVHVAGVTLRRVRQLSRSCANLKTLGKGNIHFSIIL